MIVSKKIKDSGFLSISRRSVIYNLLEKEETMKYIYLLLLLIHSSNTMYTMQHITKGSFKQDTITQWTALIHELVLTAPEMGIDMSQGLSAIITSMHQQTISALLEDANVLASADHILATLPSILQKMSIYPNATHTEQVKLALMNILQESLITKHQQQLKLPAYNTHAKIISSGKQAFQDNLELMQLNTHLDTTCTTDIKAFMAVYFYLLQEQDPH
jgi:hypothetical protein